jgi:hypothetical protein
MASALKTQAVKLSSTGPLERSASSQALAAAFILMCRARLEVARESACASSADASAISDGARVRHRNDRSAVRRNPAGASWLLNQSVTPTASD